MIITKCQNEFQAGYNPDAGLTDEQRKDENVRYEHAYKARLRLKGSL